MNQPRGKELVDHIDRRLRNIESVVAASRLIIIGVPRITDLERWILIPRNIKVQKHDLEVFLSNLWIAIMKVSLVDRIHKRVGFRVVGPCVHIQWSRMIKRILIP